MVKVIRVSLEGFGSTDFAIDRIKEIKTSIKKALDDTKNEKGDNFSRDVRFFVPGNPTLKPDIFPIIVVSFHYPETGGYNIDTLRQNIRDALCDAVKGWRIFDGVVVTIKPFEPQMEVMF